MRYFCRYQIVYVIGKYKTRGVMCLPVSRSAVTKLNRPESNDSARF